MNAAILGDFEATGAIREKPPWSLSGAAMIMDKTKRLRNAELGVLGG